MHSFEHDTGTSRTVFGVGTLPRVAAELAAVGGRRALVLSTPGQRGLAQRVADELGAAAAGIFDGAAPHTPVEVTDAALARLGELGADAVVSVGGGSTTGLGKALAARTGLPHLVVPTTYAGSEVTSLLGETANGEKVTRTGPEILPRVVVYDVALTTSLPWPVTVTSAVNAMAHAVEALYAPDRTAATDALAVDGLCALATGLRSLHADPDDLDARADLLRGAWLAGRCLEAVGMGLHHKLCHTLGGSFGLPHAPTHTVVLPHAMAYNAPAAPEAMGAAAAALGVDDAPSGLQALVADLGGPVRLDALGFTLADVPRAADLATARPYPHPRPVERDGIAGLLTDATEGTPIRPRSTGTDSATGTDLATQPPQQIEEHR
jgi:maleylacetate reductase